MRKPEPLKNPFQFAKSLEVECIKKYEDYSESDIAMMLFMLEKQCKICSKIYRNMKKVKSPEFSMLVTLTISPFLFWFSITFNLLGIIILGTIFYLNFCWQIFNIYKILNRHNK